MESHGRKNDDKDAIQLTRSNFSLRLYKTNLRVDQWARLCLLFSSIDEVLREESSDEPLEWRKVG